MIYLQLFLTFCTVGLLGFGGGYGATALMQDLVVTQRGWLTMKEFTDVITVSEMTPGPLGINIASFVGVQVAGVPGTVVATLSYVLPSIIIVSCLARIYLKYRQLEGVQRFLQGLQPAVCAMIFAAAARLAGNALWGGTITLPTTNWLAVGLCAVFFLLLRMKKISPLKAIFASGFIGAALYAALGLPI